MQSENSVSSLKQSVRVGDLVVRVRKGRRDGAFVHVTGLGAFGWVVLSDGYPEKGQCLEVIQPFYEGEGGVL